MLCKDDTSDTTMLTSIWKNL